MLKQESPPKNKMKRSESSYLAKKRMHSPANSKLMEAKVPRENNVTADDNRGTISRVNSNGMVSLSSFHNFFSP